MPIEMSETQIKAFAALFPGNARPVQPLNRRFLLRSPWAVRGQPRGCLRV